MALNVLKLFQKEYQGARGKRNMQYSRINWAKLRKENNTNTLNKIKGMYFKGP